MTKQQQEMIEYTTQEVITYIVEDKKISVEEAMRQFYLSDTFKKLENVETGLYLDGSAYVYEYLKEEKGWIYKEGKEATDGKRRKGSGLG